jgi:hypothetical protein
MRLMGIALAAVGLLTSAAAQQYVIDTYAGGAPPLNAATDATVVSIGSPISVAADDEGKVYFASPELNAVYKLNPSGALTRVAGNSKWGYSGDGGRQPVYRDLIFRQHARLHGFESGECSCAERGYAGTRRSRASELFWPAEQ